jgi:hypothetical protein
MHCSLRLERSLPWIIALLLGAAFEQSAKAGAYEVFDFSFSNVDGTVSGTVSGTVVLPIACLVACTDQEAIAVTVTGFPAGLDSVVGAPPFSFLPRQPATPTETATYVGADSFSVAAGEFTDADLYVAYEINPDTAPRAVSLELDSAGINYLFMGGVGPPEGPFDIPETLYVQSSDGIDGLTFNSTGIVITPEPDSWPTLLLGLSGLAWLKYRRRPKPCTS